MRSIILLLAIASSSFNLKAVEVFRCTSESGIIFSDRPCGESGQTINIEPMPKTGVYLLEPASMAIATNRSYSPPKQEMKRVRNAFHNGNDRELWAEAKRERAAIGQTKEMLGAAYGKFSNEYVTTRRADASGEYEIRHYLNRYHGAPEVVEIKNGRVVRLYDYPPQDRRTLDR